MPDRDDFPEGAEGEPAYANVFEKFAEENFDGKAVELRTIDQHELKAGFFGACQMQARQVRRVACADQLPCCQSRGVLSVNGDVDQPILTRSPLRRPRDWGQDDGEVRADSVAKV